MLAAVNRPSTVRDVGAGTRPAGRIDSLRHLLGQHTSHLSVDVLPQQAEPLLPLLGEHRPDEGEVAQRLGGGVRGPAPAVVSQPVRVLVAARCLEQRLHFPLDFLPLTPQLLDARIWVRKDDLFEYLSDGEAGGGGGGSAHGRSVLPLRPLANPPTCPRALPAASCPRTWCGLRCVQEQWQSRAGVLWCTDRPAGRGRPDARL